MLLVSYHLVGRELTPVRLFPLQTPDTYNERNGGLIKRKAAVLWLKHKLGLPWWHSV